MPSLADLKEQRARKDREKAIGTSKKALRYGLPVGALVVVVLAALAALSADPLVRSTWALSAATAGLVLATFALVAVTYWQANQYLHFEDKRERERRAREKATTRREEISRMLTDQFESAWRDEVRRRLRKDGPEQTQKVLDAFGIELSELAELFPELGREARQGVAALRRKRDKRKMEELRDRDPEAYDEEMRRRRDESMKDEQALDEDIQRQAERRAEEDQNP